LHLLLEKNHLEFTVLLRKIHSLVSLNRSAARSKYLASLEVFVGGSEALGWKSCSQL
jgi:hypothetical protein